MPLTQIFHALTWSPPFFLFCCDAKRIMLIISYILVLREICGLLINIGNILKFMIDSNSTILLRIIHLFVQQFSVPIWTRYYVIDWGYRGYTQSYFLKLLVWWKRQKYNYTDIHVHRTVTNKQEGPSIIKA